jgi:hypothetical protein
MTRHCWKCGAEWTIKGNPGRGETCMNCRADLRVCLNCLSYDRNVAQQCRDRRADPVMDKDRGNFCEWFEFVRREFKGAAPSSPRESTARDQFKKLFGD